MAKEQKPAEIVEWIDERLGITEDGTRHLIRPPGMPGMMPQMKPEPAKKEKAMPQERNNTRSMKKEPRAEVPHVAVKKEQSPRQPSNDRKTASTFRGAKESKEDEDEAWKLRAEEEEQQRMQEILERDCSINLQCSILRGVAILRMSWEQHISSAHRIWR